VVGLASGSHKSGGPSSPSSFPNPPKLGCSTVLVGILGVRGSPRSVPRSFASRMRETTRCFPELSYHIISLSFTFSGENKIEQKVRENETVTWLGLMGQGKGIELTAASNFGLTSMKRHRPVSGTCSKLLRTKTFEGEMSRHER
jgi:hypothetical protein